MKTTSIKIDADLENKINYLCKEKSISKSMLVREALLEYVSNSNVESKS